MSRNLWILVCFLVFNTSVVTYAIIYYTLYRRRPQVFLFAGELYEARTAEFRASTERLLSDLVSELAALAELHTVLIDLGELPPLDIDRPLPENFSWRLVWRATAGFATAVFGYFLEVRGPQGQLISEIDIGAGGKRTVGRQIDRRARRQQSYQRRLDSILSDLPDVWSFPDFLYFSLITQSTVGYGDILPNSTAIRLTVATQIWMSYVILIVLINIVLP